MESFGHIFVCINNNVVMSSVLSVRQFYVVNHVFKGHLYMFRHTKVFITKVNLTVEQVLLQVSLIPPYCPTLHSVAQAQLRFNATFKAFERTGNFTKLLGILVSPDNCLLTWPNHMTKPL